MARRRGRSQQNSFVNLIFFYKKLYKLKQNKFHDFLVESMYKSYILYKKNKNCKISFNDYQAQLLKEFEKQNNLKNWEIKNKIYISSLIKIN